MSGISFRANLVTEPRTETINAKKENLKDNVVNGDNKATLLKDIEGARNSGQTDMYVSVTDSKTNKASIYRVDLNENKAVIDNLINKTKSGAVKLDTNIDFKPSAVNFNVVKKSADVQPLRQAQGWKPGEAGLTGVQANKTINETYDKLDHTFNSYLSPGKPVANWMTFGKYASREAGSQIKSLEGALEALKTFGTNNGTTSDDIKAGKTLYHIMSQPDMIAQGALLGTEIIKGIVTDPKEQAKLISDLKNAMKTGSPVSIGLLMEPILMKAGASGINNAMKRVEELHNGLVEGNTRIYENVVPAYEAFLAAETSGKDGLKALKDAGYGKPAPPNDKNVFAEPNMKDPQGFIMDAFKTYKEAKLEFLNGNRDKGEALMHKANLLIGCQEQLAILQRPSIFGDKLQGMVDAMSGTMTLTDGNGKRNALLNTKLDANGNQSVVDQVNTVFKKLDPNAPKEKGWSDFETRMGIKAVPKDTPGSIPVRMPSGETKYFVQRDLNDPKAQGTISKYFSDGLSGDNLKRNMTDSPRAMNQFYTSADMKIGNTDYQIGNNVAGPYNTAREAMSAAAKYQSQIHFDNPDLMVMRANDGKFYAREITTLSSTGSDIADSNQMKNIKFVGQSADNVYAVMAENGAIKFNNQFKK